MYIPRENLTIVMLRSRFIPSVPKINTDKFVIIMFYYHIFNFSTRLKKFKA